MTEYWFYRQFPPDDNKRWVSGLWYGVYIEGSERVIIGCDGLPDVYHKRTVLWEGNNKDFEYKKLII